MLNSIHAHSFSSSVYCVPIETHTKRTERTPPFLRFHFFPFPSRCLWHTHAGHTQMYANVSVYYIHKTWYVCWYFARLPDRFCCSFRTALVIFIKTGTDSEWVRSTIWMVLFFTFGQFRYFLLLRDILYLFVALTRWHWNYYCFCIGIFYVCASCVIRLSLYLSVFLSAHLKWQWRIARLFPYGYGHAESDYWLIKLFSFHLRAKLCFLPRIEIHTERVWNCMKTLINPKLDLLFSIEQLKWRKHQIS